MKITQNVIKGTITSIVGVLTMAITLFLVFTRAIDFVWNGIAGLVIGCILLFTPKSIEMFILEAIKSWGRRAVGMFGYGFGYDDDKRGFGDITDRGEGNQKP